MVSALDRRECDSWITICVAWLPCKENYTFNRPQALTTGTKRVKFTTLYHVKLIIHTPLVTERHGSNGLFYQRYPVKGFTGE